MVTPRLDLSTRLLRLRLWARRRRLELLAVAFVGFAFSAVSPWFPGLQSPNERSRVYLAEALAIDGSVRIDDAVRRQGPVADFAVRGEHVYSDKAPGLSFLCAPWVAAQARLLPDASHEARVRLVRLVGALLPTLAIVWMLLRRLQRDGLGARARLALVTAYAFGTVAAPYGALAFGHQLAAACLFGAFLAASGRSHAWLGLLAASAVAVEYPTAFVAAWLVLAALLERPTLRAVGRVALGAAAPAALLAAYHTAAFG